MPREADVPYFNYRKGTGEEWRAAAVCGPVGTKHPWCATGPGAKPALRVGQAICRDLCPVQPQCLAYAIVANIEHGTWGGMTERERGAMSAAARRSAIAAGRTMPYDGLRLVEECAMVVIIAKVKFVPHLSPGEVGEVEDTVARAAIRNGYAELVGKVLNFDDWMYNGAELQLGGRTIEGERSRETGKAHGEMVEPTTAMTVAPNVP